METKRDIFERMARSQFDDETLEEWVKQYDDAAPDDAPRLEPGETVNGEMMEAALDWAREQGRREAQNHEQVQQVIIDKLKGERNETQFELTKYKTLLNEAESRWQREKEQRLGFEKHIKQLDKELEQAKDARIIAEKEANDLRAWRKGLVKPGRIVPSRSPVVVISKRNNIRLTVNMDAIDLTDRWFDPREIFEAADRDAEE